MAIFMTQWVVYKNPLDYPGQYVVRKWHIIGGNLSADTVPEIVTPDYIAATKVIPAGLYRMDRFTSDDPAILEVWL